MSVLLIENLIEGQGGGKAKGLALLNKFRLAIPKTFVVTSFELKSIEEFAASLDQDMDYAVRSSASAEDGSEHSYAGQFESYLNIKGKNAIVNALHDCFKSVKSVTVESYKKDTNAGNGIQMNVLVQEMIHSRFSGAIFTADPVKQRRDTMCVSITPGLGEELMAGHQEGENLCFFKHSRKMPLSKLLKEEIFTALVEESKRIEKLFGNPADLEWAIDEDDKIWWLQLRPITSLNDIHVNELDHSPRFEEPIYTRGNIGEMMPGPVTPLTMSTFGRAIEVGLQVFYKKIGAIKELSDDNLFVHSFYNHLFFDMNGLYESTRRVSLSKKVNIDYSVVGEIVPGKVVKRENSFFQGVFNFIKMTRFINSAPKAKKELKKIYDNFRIETKEDLAEQYQLIDENLQILFDTYSLHYVTSSQSGALYAAILNIHSKGKVPQRKDQELVSKLFSNIPDVESADVLRYIDELAILLAKGVNVNTEFLKANEEDSYAYLTKNASEEIRTAWSQFVDRHGHRCVREAEMYEKEWAIDPSYVIQSIKAKASLLVNGHQRKINGYANKPISLNDNGLSKRSRFIVKQLLPKARKAVARREQTKAYSIGIQYQFKLAYRRLAKLMVDAKYLNDEEQIYFLQHHEIGKAISSDNPEYWLNIAEQRRRLYPEMQALSFPDLSFAIPIPEESSHSEHPGELIGIPVSQGLVEGKVRLVKSLDDVSQLERDEIMVARYTDIGWTPYYSIISGLITEIGSPLSHGAVVAREYGLPAIVSLKGAMSMLKTGQQIRLDAIKGEVEILSDGN